VTPIRILFVARISVRKGLEHVVELSRRLDDLSGQIQLDVIGGHTQWSDYRGHLKELNPRTSRYAGPLSHRDVMAEYEKADILVLPSMYEPGGLVLGEALSRGLCAVVSDEVGSGEPVDDEVCRKFPAGDMDQFERQTRKLIGDLRLRRTALREAARAQAIEHFAPDRITRRFIGLLEQVIKPQSIVKQSSELVPARD
jgi:glycosyltransferase involved in cell wall biosynthesis